MDYQHETSEFSTPQSEPKRKSSQSQKYSGLQWKLPTTSAGGGDEKIVSVKMAEKENERNQKIIKQNTYLYSLILSKVKTCFGT